MARPKTHRDVEFHVQSKQTKTKIFKHFDEAAAQGLVLAASGNTEVVLDTCVWSPAGARWIGGDEAVRQYKEAPDASVFNRLEIKANDIGRVG